jgi:hypothetical protein
MVLAEGGYSAVARNKDKIYQRDFTVVAGRNTDVEVLMKDQQPQPPVDAARTVQQVPVGTPPPPGVQPAPVEPLPSYEQLVPQPGGDDTSLD